MKRVDPYLHFNGNAEEAFTFYKSIFGGEFRSFQRYKDMPGAEKIPESQKDKILHVSLAIGKDNVLMGSDMHEEAVDHFVAGTNYSFSLEMDSEEEANDVFNALSIKGHIIMPLEKTFWGAYFGMCTDRFGIHWMINYEYKK